MRARFIPDPAGIAAISLSPALQAVMKMIGDSIAEEARSISRSEAYLSGDYHDGIQVETGVVGHKVASRVNANDFKSHWIEFGTGHPGPTQAYQPLRRAAENSGYRLGAAQEGD